MASSAKHKARTLVNSLAKKIKHKNARNQLGSSSVSRKVKAIEKKQKIGKVYKFASFLSNNTTKYINFVHNAM